MKKVFPPELINRIDEKLVFRSLTKKDMESIVSLELNVLSDRLEKKRSYLEVLCRH